VEQKLLDPNKLSDKKEFIEENAKKIKLNLIESNLIAKLQQKYKIEIYLKENE